MILRALASIVGVIAFYAAFLMYEDEEGRWQDRIEALWVAIADRERQIGSRFAALLGKVAEVVTRGIDRIFGRELLSLRMIGASTSTSLAAFGLVAVVFWNVITSEPRSSIPKGAIVASCVCITCAILPITLRWKWLVGLSLFPLLFLALGLADINHSTSDPTFFIAFLTSLFLGIICDVLSTILIRVLIRRVATYTTACRIIIALLAQLLFGFLVTSGPILLLISLHSHRIQLGAYGEDVLESMLFVNLSTGLLSLSMAAVLAGLLIHLIAWPLLSRVTYPLARFEIVRNRKALAAIASFCFLYAFGIADNTLKSLLRLFSP